MKIADLRSLAQRTRAVCTDKRRRRNIIQAILKAEGYECAGSDDDLEELRVPELRKRCGMACLSYKGLRKSQLLQLLRK